MSAIFLVLSGIVIIVIALVHMNMVSDAMDNMCDLQDSELECFGMCGQVVVGAKRLCVIVWVVEMGVLREGLVKREGVPLP